MSLAKHNAFTERLSPLLRLDALSAFHHPLFGKLAPAITNPATVGKVTSANSSRAVWIGEAGI